MFDGRIVFHVGLHKTATTFLQRRVFPRLDSVAFVPYPARIRDLLPATAEGSVVLVSDEGLSGTPLAPGWLTQFRTNMQGLASLMPDAGIVIGFRRHAALLASIYKQYLHEGGTRPAKDALDLDRPDCLLRPEDLSFSERLDLLDHLFGGRVFVYTQEEIRDDLPRFVAELETFLGVPRQTTREWPSELLNVGVGNRQAEILRRLNRLDALLRRSRVLPTLNNRLFRRLSLDPRGLCQRRLAWLSPGAPLALPASVDRQRAIWDQDWRRVIEARDRRTTTDRAPAPLNRASPT